MDDGWFNKIIDQNTDHIIFHNVTTNGDTIDCFKLSRELEAE